MQIQMFPQCVCDQLDRTVRNFIWRGDMHRGMNMVNWDIVTKPKNLGSLGVRTTRDQNVALLGKLIWDLIFRINFGSPYGGLCI